MVEVAHTAANYVSALVIATVWKIKMNHELIAQFYEVAQEWSYKKYAKKETGYTREYWVSYKVAELVARECGLIAEMAEPYQANDLILKHFGIFK